MSLWPSLWPPWPPLWAPYHGKKSFLVSTLFTLFKWSNIRGKQFKGGNYSRAETSFLKGLKRGKLFKWGNYIRVDTIQGNTVFVSTHILLKMWVYKLVWKIEEKILGLVILKYLCFSQLVSNFVTLLWQIQMF